MEALLIVLKEIADSKNNGISKDELKVNLVNDLNIHKLDDLLSSLKWANVITEDKSIRYHINISKNKLSEILQKESPNISAGIVIQDPNKQILIVHPTLQEKWDIPKGGFSQDSDLNLFDTAIRELFEETGIVVDPKFVNFRGIHKITKYKSLALFTLQGPELDLSKCHCTSMFTGPDDKELPEVDEYKFVSIESLKTMLPMELYGVIIKHGKLN